MIMSRQKNSFSLLHQEMKKLERTKKPDFSSKKRGPSTSAASTSRYEKKKTSKNQIKEKEVETYDPNVPDRSYGDLYCKICDSHMNSEGMWEAHIIGKRHIKNVKKGDKDTKYEDLNVESTANPELKKVTDPVIGLSYIHEIRRPGQDVPPYYNCFLCSSISFSVPLLIEHIISYKHRLNYMKEQCTEEFELIEQTNLKKGHMEPLVLEKAIELEKQHGRGKIVVKQEKPKMSIPPSKRYRSSSEESEDYQKPSKSLRSDKGGIWKTVTTTKMCDVKSERSYKERKGEYDCDVEIVKDPYARSVTMKRDIYADRNDSYPRSMPKRERSPDRYGPYPRSMSTRGEMSPELIDSYSRSMSTRREISPEQKDPYSRSISARREISPEQKDSYSRSYKKTLQTDDYPRRSEYDKYHTDFDSRKQDSYKPTKRYEEQQKPNYNLTRDLSEEHQSQARHRQETNLLPHEIGTSQKTTEEEKIKKFLYEAFEINYDTLLKIVRARLENDEITNVQTLTLLSDIVKKAQTIMEEKVRTFRTQSSQQPGSNTAGSTMTAPETNVSSSGANTQSNGLKSLLQKYFPIQPQPPAMSSPSASAPTQQHANLHATSFQTSSVVAPAQQHANLLATQFPSSSRNYASVNPNYADAYSSSYANSQTAIPGLTLTQEVNPNSTYNNYQSVYSALPSGRNQNASYRY